MHRITSLCLLIFSMFICSFSFAGQLKSEFSIYLFEDSTQKAIKLTKIRDGKIRPNKVKIIRPGTDIKCRTLGPPQAKYTGTFQGVYRDSILIDNQKIPIDQLISIKPMNPGRGLGGGFMIVLGVFSLLVSLATLSSNSILYSPNLGGITLITSIGLIAGAGALLSNNAYIDSKFTRKLYSRRFQIDIIEDPK